MAPGKIESQDLASLDNDALRALVLQLLARIADLEARLDAAGGGAPKTPANSSLPPSSAQKGNVEAGAAGRGGKKRRPGKDGRGRPGKARQLHPDPDRVLERFATQCGCGARLRPGDQPRVHAYDHIDIPPLRPEVTRIHLHSGRCPCCAKRVSGAPPEGMSPGSPFGPGVVALVAYLHARHMVSYERLVELLDGLFGLKLSQGAIANMLARAATPFAAASERIAQTVRASPVIASDETSARVCGKTFWQWTFATATAIAHVIAPTRGKAAPQAFLGEARPEVWISDRYVAQCGFAPRHQVCLAHLIRDAQYAIDAGDMVFAPSFKRFLRRACAIGRRRSGLSDATLKSYAGRMNRELDRLLDLEPANRHGNHLRAAMSLDARDKLLVFLERRDVEPTNNVCERALRPSVIFRKVTNGFRSLWGAKVYADTCSIMATGKLAGLTALQAIRGALSPMPYA
jgi:transposase